MGKRSSAGLRAGASLVAEALVRLALAREQKQS
jgi:hypothetical protein